MSSFFHCSYARQYSSDAFFDAASGSIGRGYLFVTVLFPFQISDSPFEIGYLFVTLLLFSINLLGPVGHSSTPARARLYQGAMAVQTGFHQIKRFGQTSESLVHLTV